MLFQWTRLGLNQFRLLERRTRLPSGEPSYVLKTFTLNAAGTPKYTAVLPPPAPAYEGNDSVVLNGRSFSVSERVLRALKKVEEWDGEGCEFLWCEALCVNRRDEAEKEGQRGIMRDVVAGAETVVACLGENTPGLDDSFANHTSTPAVLDSLEDLGKMPTGKPLWSRGEISIKSQIVLYAGAKRFGPEDTRKILQSLTSEAGNKEENRQNPKDSSL